jgi:prepilin-type N-terminal cleavage/methylation domain-containing protein
MIRLQKLRHNQESGFTLIELMIATAVFAVILVLVTVAILQITRVYYKGVTESNTQNTARSIIDDISQAIQFSGGQVTATPGNTPGSSYVFCVGQQQFAYVLGYQVVNSPDSGLAQGYHGLVQNTVSNCPSSSAPNLRSTQNVPGRELLDQNMRLSKLSITNAGGSLWKVDVKVTYGDDDLLNNPTGPDTVCKSVTSGTQFCAQSELTTTVQKRVQ